MVGTCIFCILLGCFVITVFKYLDLNFENIKNSLM